MDAKPASKLLAHYLTWPTIPGVKTITASEFYAKPSARQKWKPGQVILVTTDGEPDLVVRKLGLPSKTARGCVKEIPLSGGVGVRLGKEGWQ